jgi:transglutaminase-like putative cysteine protease
MFTSITVSPSPPTCNPYQILIGIEGDYLDSAELKTHENGIDQFLSFKLPLNSGSSMTHRIRFKVLLLPVDYLKSLSSVQMTGIEQHRRYLEPSQYIESDDPLIQRIAQRFLKQAGADIIAQTKLAYEFGARHLKFVPQTPAGALASLKSRQGDCTEYSALCAALCRAQGIPARQTGVFHLRHAAETFSQPNHNSAEVFWGDAGWIPVDANLGGGRYDTDYGLGRIGNSVIVLKREGAWVWSNFFPKSGYDGSKPKPSLKAEMAWKTTVLDEGPAKQLIRKYYTTE